MSLGAILIADGHCYIWEMAHDVVAALCFQLDAVPQVQWAQRCCLAPPPQRFQPLGWGFGLFAALLL